MCENTNGHGAAHRPASPGQDDCPPGHWGFGFAVETCGWGSPRVHRPADPSERIWPFPDPVKVPDSERLPRGNGLERGPQGSRRSCWQRSWPQPQPQGFTDTAAHTASEASFTPPPQWTHLVCRNFQLSLNRDGTPLKSQPQIPPPHFCKPKLYDFFC